VTFDPKKGANSALGTVRLAQVGSATQKGAFTWRPKQPGTLVFSYAGTQATELAYDTAATAKSTVVIKK
jgi:hypothetical protein